MVKNLHLNLGDRVIVPKSKFRWVQHHAIYGGNGCFYENKIDIGVVCTPFEEFFKDVFEVTTIQRFTGTPYQLRAALARAKSLLGKPYCPVRFNCEHFANFVQFGRAWSQQVGIGAGLLLLLPLVVGLTKNAK